nr:MAG TPA_asm: LEM-like domain protein [Caudoviricetes sp.]
MTISDIKSLAADLGYTITKSLKADIVAEFLSQQEV